MREEYAKRIIDKVVQHFTSLPSVKALALVGSRGRGEFVDEYSDADFLIVIEDDGLSEVMKGDWIHLIDEPMLVFPLVMPSEIRVYYQNFFDCDFHFYTLSEIKAYEGECSLGTYLAAGCKIVYDRDDILKNVLKKVKPENEDEGDYETTASIFWFNMACTTKLILRGDLFRAYRFSNWWHQQMLLGIIEPHTPIPGNKLKYLQERMDPKLYQALINTFAPMNKQAMLKSLAKTCDCFWLIKDKLNLALNDEIIIQYQKIEKFIKLQL